ncbi:MAG TPA: alpha/beta hydrolase [Mycobacteriales bacterium]|nr:alpha/beta hydrolase [Mycobacteriales bacterium]
MDPELAALLPHLPAPDLSDPETARRRIREIFATPGSGRRPSWTERVSIEHSSVTAADGHQIPVRIYRPKTGTDALGAMLHIHGGAFVTGDLDLGEIQCGRIADAAQLVVVDVEYRLAPEHPFPTGFDDCYTALVWTADHAGDLGIDVARVAVGGESAGGALAAAVALAARDRGGPALAYQLLLYPVLDDSLTTHSVRTMTDTPMWDGPNSELMWLHYLGPVAGRGEVSPYAAPARAVATERGLAGLPPAYILACEHDPLRDEELAYAAELALAGVPVELHLVPGTFHGFDGLPTQIGKRITAEYIDSLRRALAPA